MPSCLGGFSSGGLQLPINITTKKLLKRRIINLDIEENRLTK
jgi:hypothetical protein